MNNLTHVLDDGYYYFIWQPFVERFALWYWTVILYVCLSCLSMTLVYRGQTVRWIKMPLDKEVGLGPGLIALDGDPTPCKKGAMSIVAKRHWRLILRMISSCFNVKSNQIYSP